MLTKALLLGHAGPYQLQVAIAACHCTAPAAESTDWRQIASLYWRLAEMVPSAVVLLNRAVAVARADGLAAALPLVEQLAGREELRGYYLLPVTRGDLLRRLGRSEAAAAAYRESLRFATTKAERRLVTRRLMEVEAGR